MIKAKVYRWFAMIFAGAGLLLFIILYLQNMEGQIFRAFQNPMLVVMLLVPFLPAAILSIIAKYYEGKYYKLVRALE